MISLQSKELTLHEKKNKKNKKQKKQKRPQKQLLKGQWVTQTWIDWSLDRQPSRSRKGHRPAAWGRSAALQGNAGSSLVYKC